ncbi:sensor histidine kinase [Stackebrandtia nassauensis]|uniref:histidine kinase n=1 Tax=Stackebrandtia nassauensis (strain DSM 44728 / CIP 108903 / NRRL B-16338 / NBRC 102104 / LLR-40K-21) TaxID=446470 RepID=D3PX05_STANL|nr:nitrate- and nitrite sensing domain-containing protein [Stackebrandtia nassauensis]ADD45229.1 histidine kinase [Stackebrandtia nassauensis DSM 44728]
MRIGSKLALILLIPLVALSGVVAVRLVDSTLEALRIGDTARVVELTKTVAETLSALQEERHQMAVQIYGDELNLDEDQRDLRHLDEAVYATDEKLGALKQARETFEGDAEVREQLEQADKPLNRLDRVRSAELDESEEVYLTVYDAAVRRLMRVLDRAVDLVDDAELSRRVRAASLLASADEYSERLRVLILQLPDGKPLAAAYRPFMTLSLSRSQTMSEYRRIGGEAVFEAGGLGGGAARPANSLESTVATSRTDENVDIDHAELMGAYDARHKDTATYVDDTQDSAVTLARSIRDDVVLRVLIETVIVLLTVAVAVMATLWLGRPVIRGLRQLRDSARRIAYEELPTAVKQVSEHEGLAGLTPREFADNTAAPLKTQGAAEIIEVGEAFDDVHHEAIRVAAEQALLRVHIGTMFVRLARRGHSLTGRLTATLDEAERDEQDPNRLQLLFRLDHLVALLGRANDSLLVLGGAAAARVRTSDEKLNDVLTAAQSHTEHYTRINVTTVDEGVWISSTAVEDVVQILAELMDNATQYSRHPTEVIARYLTDRVVIQIRDYGIGIDPQRMSRYNARLGTRAPLDLEAMQSMGLTVVGQLAKRHGIQVRLQPATESSGTTAEVVLPHSILRFARDLTQQRQLSNAAPADATEAPLFRGGLLGIGSGPATVPDAAAGLPVIHFEWQTVHADSSLRAGAALPSRETTYDEVTGLPRRRPRSQLVPGAVAPTHDRPDAPARRDPEAIGATYTAFARGLFGDAGASPTDSRS